ncbi:hypothetical protein GTX14_17620 [Streptomyces sp. SID4944]|nr:hypothetical protein [Streptomyces sp. SID4944]
MARGGQRQHRRQCHHHPAPAHRPEPRHRCRRDLRQRHRRQGEGLPALPEPHRRRGRRPRHLVQADRHGLLRLERQRGEGGTGAAQPVRSRPGRGRGLRVRYGLRRQEVPAEQGAERGRDRRSRHLAGAGLRLGLRRGGGGGSTKLTHAQVSSMFSGAGITWTSTGNCSNRNVSTCTSFEQMRRTTAEGTVALRRASGCAILVTGGTETGHANGTYSHWNGYKVDFSPQSCISNYITRTFTRIGDRGDGAAQYKSASGNVYAREGSHWDVTFHN